MRLTKNFTVDEFKCQCGCNCCDMSPLYMARLQKIRDTWGRPMAPSSGFRCAKHNMKTSSTGPKGPHALGLASDWRYSGSDAYKLVALAAEAGIRKIGIQQKGPRGKRFIHLADDKPPTGHDAWLYSY